jgi:enoyl-CoA hydratase
MGSILTALVEYMGSHVRPDANDLELTEETLDQGLAKSVKSNDEQFPPYFRLSKAGRRAPS